MKRYIYPKLFSHANNLIEVNSILTNTFTKIRGKGFKRIGYVSGVITLDGRENIFRNLKKLEKTASRLRKKYDFPIFSSSDVAGDKLHSKFEKLGVSDMDWDYFWNSVLLNKEHFVTDIFMDERWELSYGSIDEHLAAQRMDIKIHYLKNEVELPLKVKLFKFVKQFLHIK